MGIPIADFGATLAIGVYFWLTLLILAHCAMPGGIARAIRK
jgi:hypothetical protein